MRIHGLLVSLALVLAGWAGAVFAREGKPATLSTSRTPSHSG